MHFQGIALLRNVQALILVLWLQGFGLGLESGVNPSTAEKFVPQTNQNPTSKPFELEALEPKALETNLNPEA